MKFSIVIPTYNRPGHVAELLEAWERVEYPKDDYELILADDGGRESLEPVVGPWEGRLSVRLLRLEHVSASSARASGLAVARGELVLCSDDDCRPDPGVLRAYAEAAREHPGAALGGPVVNLLVDDVYATATQEMITFIGEEWNRVGACFFTFSSLVFPAGAFRANGGFDAGWLWRTGEDRDVCRRWCESGGEMVSVPGALMGHAHGLTLRKYWRQHFHYGQGNYASRRNRRNEAGAPDFSGVGFYWRLLTRPFRGYGFGRAVILLGLILLAQVANVWGTLDAARRVAGGGRAD
jgi:GT2 family glycosyltransferase